MGPVRPWEERSGVVREAGRVSQGLGAQQGLWGPHTQWTLVYPP